MTTTLLVQVADLSLRLRLRLGLGSGCLLRGRSLCRCFGLRFGRLLLPECEGRCGCLRGCEVDWDGVPEAI